ncbi:MAG: acyl-CoA dehydrogenase family protein [Deltaproteobacteria bacterium]|nr:acyl-CoA dehydrogenase family protein [Deltaproteobacteria bacterium]
MLTEEQRLIRETARKFAQQELLPKAAEIDETEGFYPEQFKKMGRLGLLGITVPEKWGGTGADVLSATLVMEEFGRVCASTALSYLAHSILCVHNLAVNTSDEQRAKYLPALISGEKIGGMAMTEPGAGSDSLGMRLKAEKKGDSYLLNGEKTFITNGPVGETFVVYARTGSQRTNLTSFIVEKGFEGFSVGKKIHKLGMRGSPTSELIFKDCKVSAQNIVGKEGGGVPMMMNTLDVERTTIAGISLGIAQAALEQSLKYSSERKQFEEPIIEFQMIQKMIADMHTELEAARALVYATARKLDRKERATRESSAAKLYASEMATRAGNWAIQIFGGYGYTREFPVERYWRDAKLMEIGAGTSEVQRKIIVRELREKGIGASVAE